MVKHSSFLCVRRLNLMPPLNRIDFNLAYGCYDLPNYLDYLPLWISQFLYYFKAIFHKNYSVSIHLHL